MIVLGIDPGLHISGYGIAQRTGSKIILLDSGYLQMSYSKSIPERIGIFHAHFEELVIRWGITDIAIETPFLGRNVQSFLKLGYLRGIVNLLSNTHACALHEFAPRQVKSAATGYGGASKEQVARMILQLFPTLKTPKKDDVTDALAVMLCGLWKAPLVHTVKKQ
jgi:crossover junction endodeoxyribonuclease RuvC